MMSIFQKMMYVVLSITVACAIGVANYIYLPAGQRIPEDKPTSDYIETYYSTNDKVLKQLFPYEEVDYALAVPSNMSYTTADFQRFEGTYLTERESVDSSYLKHICFCGDSITYHMTLKNRLLTDCDVLAWGGLMVSDFAKYVDNPVYNHSSEKKTSIYWIEHLQPEIIYIMLGTNGITLINNERHIEQYRTLLDKIAAASPSSIIVLCSAPPWGTAAYGNYTNSDIETLNQKINHFNMYLLELAKERGYYYLNVAEVLMDEVGNLKASYTSDGIHWSNSARDAYEAYVLSHPIPGY